MKQLSKQGSSITQNNTENQQTELQIKLYAKEINRKTDACANENLLMQLRVITTETRETIH